MGNLQELADEDLFEAIQVIFKHTNKPVKLIAHSMIEILCRCLTDPDRHKNSKNENINAMISEICTLATPHLGFSIKRKKKFKLLTSVLSKFENWVVKRRNSRFYNGFFQFLSGSDLFVQLNYGPLLNPKIKWRNAIAMHDIFIHEASFLPNELLGHGYLAQKIFSVHHFKIPYADFLNKWTSNKKIQKRLKFFENTIDILKQPPIYRFVEVYDWIFSKREIIQN